jgi:integrase
LGRRKIDDVTAADIRRLHFKFRATPYQANRILALLSKLFSWSGRRGDKNPCIGIERYAEQKRRRYLSQAELARLGVALHDAEVQWGQAQDVHAHIDDACKALKEAQRRNDRDAARIHSSDIADRQRTLKELGGLVSAYAIAAVRLLVFTGARLNEVLTLEWAHVDFERAALNLPVSKTGVKSVHLNPPALDVLTKLPRVAGNPFVIPGERQCRHMVNLEKPWRRLRNRAELPDVRLHDLRHSFASVGAGAGLGLPIIGALLGHTQAATTARYAHLADDPLKQATDLIGPRLAIAMAVGTESHVVAIPTKRPLTR